MKHECHCHEHHEHHEHDGRECHCHGHHEHHDGECCCHDREDYSAVEEMFGLNDSVPEDALSLLQLEMNECDDLAELLGVGRDPDVDDILQEAIGDLSEKTKKTLMNLAIILHDYLPD